MESSSNLGPRVSPRLAKNKEQRLKASLEACEEENRKLKLELERKDTNEAIPSFSEATTNINF